MNPPPRWKKEQLETARLRAIEVFRLQRMEEPLEAYLEAFDDYQGIVEDLLEVTVDLTALESVALEVFTDADLLEAVRYLPGPPISTDDLKTVADAVFSKSRLQSDPEMVKRIIDVVTAGLDRRRFVWVAEGREPTEAERAAAVLASAAIMATRRLETDRRTGEKDRQERFVEEALLNAGLKKVATRTVNTNNEAPKSGEFCRESMLGNRKADFLIGLRDQRLMPIECKVSNSSTNSVKRLNNDAAVKAEIWRNDFGVRNIVPSAILSGVYKLHNLETAQSRGLSLFWAHDLAAMIAWIRKCK